MSPSVAAHPCPMPVPGHRVRAPREWGWCLSWSQHCRQHRGDDGPSWGCSRCVSKGKRLGKALIWARRGGSTSVDAHGTRAPPPGPQSLHFTFFPREKPRTSCGPYQIKIPKYSSYRLGNGIFAPPGGEEPVPAATPSTHRGHPECVGAGGSLASRAPRGRLELASLAVTLGLLWKAVFSAGSVNPGQVFGVCGDFLAPRRAASPLENPCSLQRDN